MYTVQVGDVVSGVVQSVKPYGAFIDLGGTTGLLHVSQISHDRIMNVDKILSEGDKLKVGGSFQCISCHRTDTNLPDMKACPWDWSCHQHVVEGG